MNCFNLSAVSFPLSLTCSPVQTKGTRRGGPSFARLRVLI